MDEYHADIDWSPNSWPELDLSNIFLNLHDIGIETPTINSACELAFGQGVMITSYSASMPETHWFGTDLNRSHVESTSKFGNELDSKLSLYNEPFSEFKQRPDLPKFDLVVLTGTWSWISDDDRTNIVEFLKNQLNDGGIFVIHYITYPGSIEELSFRWQVLDFLPDPIPVGTDVSKMVSQLLDALQERLNCNHQFRRNNPLQEKFIQNLRKRDPDLIAHEYFNVNWSPNRFKEMASVLRNADMLYGCPLQPRHKIDQINLTTDQLTYLSKLTDQFDRESAYDFFVNRTSRIECWIKQEKKPRNNYIQIPENLKFIQVADWPPENNVCYGALGTFELDMTMLKVVLDAALKAENTSLPALQKYITSTDMSPSDLKNSLWMLINLEILKPAFKNVSQKAIDNCKSLNMKTFSEINTSKTDKVYLAAPRIAGAMEIDSDLFAIVIGWINGHRTEEALSQFAVEANVKKQPAEERKHKIREISKHFLNSGQYYFRSLGIIASENS